MSAARIFAVGAMLLAGLTGCTSHNSAHAAIAPVTNADRRVSSGPPAALRACRMLIGKATSAAIIGEQVTCGFGGSDTLARGVSVLVEPCPDTSPFYVFYSTSHDATDHAVYYGSESSPLFSTSHQAANLAAETRQACVS
ncbi:MAG: hypothetical protein M3N95_12260 [Actinomycetota bacterium]|nr:hypothetical protein [Actinomycetota bacterium]